MHKEPNFDCQIEVKWEGYENLVTMFKHNQVELIEDMGLQHTVHGEEAAKKSTCEKKATNAYDPDKEDKKMKAIKAEGKQIEQDNKDTKERIHRSITICNSQ